MKFVKTCILCILSLFAAFQASAQSIVGAWTAGDTTVEGASVLVFLANGHYFQIQNAKASEAPHGVDGFERGTYTWDPATGALTIATIQDLNGDTGLSNLNGMAGLTFTVSGDAGTVTIPGSGSVSGTRVTGTSPIVGAWSIGNAALPDSSAVLVFLPNGVYFMAQDGDSSPVTGDPSGHDGIEHGTYSWNPTTGVLTSSRTPAPYVDTNGQWGLSNPSSSQPPRVNVSADGLTLTGTDGSDTFSVSRIGTAGSTPPSLNFQGIWWNAPAESESGWGINFAHQGDFIFAAWYTYDANGRAWWLTMNAPKTGPNTYAGKLYENRGPPLNAFNKDLVTSAEVGDGTLTFADGEHGTFRYTVNGVTQTKPLVRFAFGAMPTCTWGAQANLALATNYQDMWWALSGAESGWGATLTHQGDIIFVAWFTYDLDGKPLWLTATIRKSAAGVYSGDVNRTIGPAFSASPWTPATPTKVGDLTITFANGNHASFHYTLTLGAVAIDQTKTIERFVFLAPGTVCQ